MNDIKLETDKPLKRLIRKYDVQNGIPPFEIKHAISNILQQHVAANNINSVKNIKSIASSVEDANTSKLR